MKKFGIFIDRTCEALRPLGHSACRPLLNIPKSKERDVIQMSVYGMSIADHHGLADLFAFSVALSEVISHRVVVAVNSIPSQVSLVFSFPIGE